MDPFKLNFITASSFQWSKGFHFSPKVNEPEDGYNDQISSFGMFYHTAYLRIFYFFARANVFKVGISKWHEWTTYMTSSVKEHKTINPW